jgi:hypothetical protein
MTIVVCHDSPTVDAGAHLMHIVRLGVLTLLVGVLVTIASCRFYDDDGVPSSTWTWMCDDGSLAPDAGCPDGVDIDGGGDDDSDARRTR